MLTNLRDSFRWISGDGPVASRGAAERERVIVMSQIILRVCRHGALETRMRLVHFSLIEVRHSERGMGHSQIGIELQRFLEIRVSVFAPAVNQQIAEIGLC